MKCDRGVHTAENYFKDMKFMGKGNERQDLNNVMKRLEHWAHRLYPNYDFDDFIATAEKLGKKKQMQTHMYRYRQGILEVDKVQAEVASDEEDNAANMEGVEPIDELDEIIDQQIQNYSVAPPKTPAHNTTFDSMRSSVIATPQFMARNPVGASTPFSVQSDSGVRPLPETPTSTPKPATPSLTSEQMAQIAENRRLAQERLKAKREALLKQQQEEQQRNTQLSQIDEE